MYCNIDIEEKVRVVDHYTQQLINSGYNSEQTRDLIESGLKGMKRKEERRKKRCNRFRSAEETLEERETKKLIESTTWFKDTETENEEEDNKKRRDSKENAWSVDKKTIRKRKRINEIEVDGKKKIMAVTFIPHTARSELAKKMREKLESLEHLGNLKMKIVEQTGDKIVDLLHRSDPWSNKDCGREDCLLCKSANENEKKGLCKRRNIVYETFCISCKENEKKKKREERERDEEIEEKEIEIIIGENDGKVEEKKRKREWESTKEDKRKDKRENEERKEKKEKEKEEYKVKYVGETARSGYERCKEHVRDFENYYETSHLLKHYLLYHKDIKMSEMKYGMRVRKSFRSALERQVGEAIAIDMEQRRGLKLMNSKSEYNRCKIPRICTKTEKDLEKERQEENAEELRVKDEIKGMRKKKRDKKIEDEMSQPSLKRVCIEISNENILNWKERKKKEVEKKEKEEKEITEDWERENRKRRGEKEKEALLKKLRVEGKIEKKIDRGRRKIVAEEKKKLWKMFREEVKEDTKDIDNEAVEKEVTLISEIEERKYGEKETTKINEKQKNLKVSLNQSTLKLDGEKISLKVTKNQKGPKSDRKPQKCDKKLPKSDRKQSTIVLKGPTPPLKCHPSKVVGGDGDATIKVTGGDDVVKIEKGPTPPLKCHSSKVVVGDNDATIIVKGGDDVVEKGPTPPLKCHSSKVVGGDGSATIIVKGGDDVVDKGPTPPQKCLSSDSDKGWTSPIKGPSSKVVGGEVKATKKVTGGDVVMGDESAHLNSEKIDKVELKEFQTLPGLVEPSKVLSVKSEDVLKDFPPDVIRDFSLKCESVPSRERLLISKNLSPNVVVKKFDKKVVESAKDDTNACLVPTFS